MRKKRHERRHVRPGAHRADTERRGTAWHVGWTRQPLQRWRSWRLSLPSSGYVRCLCSGGLALTSVELVLLAAVGLWSAARVVAWRRPQSPPGLAWPALLWLVFLTVSSLLAPDHRGDALKYTARTATGLLAGWAVYDIVVSSRQGEHRRRLLLRFLALAGVAVTLLGLAELVQWEPALRWLAGFKKAPTRVGDLLRISATLGYATVTAMVLELTLPLLLAWLLTTRRAWQRAVLAIAVTAQMALLVLTLTRGGVLALFAGLVVMAGLAWRRSLRTVAAGSLAAAFLLVGWVGVLLVVNPLAGLRLKSESEAGWYQATYQRAAGGDRSGRQLAGCTGRGSQRRRTGLGRRRHPTLCAQLPHSATRRPLDRV